MEKKQKETMALNDTVTKTNSLEVLNCRMEMVSDRSGGQKDKSMEFFHSA
jgi:hypothetical protein